MEQAEVPADASTLIYDLAPRSLGVVVEVLRRAGHLGPSESTRASERTQRVTANDLRTGQIHVPATAKRFFPNEKGSLEVVLRGTRLRGSYDPRLGPDRERSGVLRLGKGFRSSSTRTRCLRSLAGWAASFDSTDPQPRANKPMSGRAAPVAAGERMNELGSLDDW